MKLQPIIVAQRHNPSRPRTVQQMRSLSLLLVTLLILAACATMTQPAFAAWPLSTDDALELCQCAPLLHGAIASPLVAASSVLARAAQRVLHRSVEGIGSLPGMHASCAMSTRTALARASSGNVAAKRSTTKIFGEAVGTSLSRELIASANPTATHVAADEAQPGFHRQLRTTLRVESKSPVPSSSGSAVPTLAARLNSCDLLMLEPLSSSFYFDLYQLHDVWRFRSQQQQQTTGATTSAQPIFSSFPAAPYPAMRALSWEDIDVEASTEASPPHLLWLLADTPQWTASAATSSDAAAADSAADAASITLQLPIHARYQAARHGCTDTDAGCLRTAVMEAPRFWLRCPSADASVTGASTSVSTDASLASSAAASVKSEWFRLEVSPEAASPIVQMTVPIADLDQRTLLRCFAVASDEL